MEEDQTQQSPRTVRVRVQHSGLEEDSEPERVYNDVYVSPNGGQYIYSTCPPEEVYRGAYT